MFEKLQNAVDQKANEKVAQIIRHLATKPTPPGVSADASDDGIILSGKHLRRRYITDPNLRNFTR